MSVRQKREGVSTCVSIPTGRLSVSVEVATSSLVMELHVLVS